MNTEAYSLEFQTRSIAFDDKALVAACARGKIQAFGLLVNKHQDRLFNAMCRLCGDEELAGEVSQDAFVKALEHISDFRGASRFYTWLFGIALNVLRKHRRVAAVSGVGCPNGGPDLCNTQAAPLADNPARKAENAETHRRVMAAILALDFDHRTVVVLRDIEDFDYEQIAAILAAPVGTIKSRLHRARKILREKLADLVEPRQ